MDELTRWLDAYGLGEYLPVFTDNDVRFTDLVDLTEDDVRELGLPLGARRRLIAAVQRTAQSASLPSAPLATAAEAGAEDQTLTAQPDVERRQLTVLFADLVGSTELSRRLDAEDLREVNRAYQDVAKTAIERFDGYVARYMGDGILAYFGYPVAHEDDAERAVRAGLQLASAVSGLAVHPGLSARVGIATGSVVVGDIIGEGASQERAVVGTTPNLAARLQGLADPGAVLVDSTTHAAIGGTFRLRRLPPATLKGFDEALPVWRIEGEADVESRFEARSATRAAFVGRSHELGLLLERWETAAGGEGQVVLLHGEPGIGKSRMAEELHARIGASVRHTRLRYQCSPYHATTPLYPVVQQLQRAAGFVDSDAVHEKLCKIERLLAHRRAPSADVLGLFAALLSLPCTAAGGNLHLTPESQRQKTIDALLAELVEVATGRPTLLVLEDAHWIDPTTHELFRQTVARIATAPVMVLITHRPEWKPGFDDQPHIVSLALSRLVSRQATALVQAVASSHLAEDTLRQITERAGGIPLFIEELTRAVVESRSGNAKSTIPVTLQASLAARIDRLDAGRDAIQAAAVIGREFEPWTLGAAMGVCEAELERPLRVLQESGLVYLASTHPKPVYVFKHALVQEVAYGSLVRTRRRELHSQVADTLRGGAAAAAGSEDALLAHHLRAAERYDEAATHWLAAARWSVLRSANDEVIALATNALADLEQADPGGARAAQRSEANRLIGESLMAQQGFGAPDVRGRLLEALTLARAAPDAVAEGRALCAYLPSVLSIEGPAATIRMTERITEIASAQGDVSMQTVASTFTGIGQVLLGDQRSAVDHFGQAWKIAEGAEFAITPTTAGADVRIPLLGYLSFSQVLRCEPECAKRAIDRASAIARRYDHPYTSAWSLTVAGRVLAYRGLYAQATSTLDLALEVCDQHGFIQRGGHARCLRGLAQARAGFLDPALHELTEGLELWRTHGTVFQSTEYLSYLAAIDLDLGQVEAAVLRLDEADALDSQLGEGFFRAERMRLRARCVALGRSRDAVVAMLEEARALAQQQGTWLFHLRASCDLAREHERRGQPGDAIRVLDDSLACAGAGAGLPEFEAALSLRQALKRPPR